MPKSSRGGQRASSKTNATVITGNGSSVSSAAQPAQSVQAQRPTPAPIPTPQQVAQGNVMPAGGIAFKSFEGMTDDQKADVINSALASGVPMFLDDSGMQKFAYFTGMTDKPQIVSESQLQSMPGQDLWRSVGSAYKSSTDIGYSHSDIYNQIAKGDYTNYSDSGGSVHGKAIYFDTSKGSYGSGKNYTVMHAKFAPGAKTISETKLDNMYKAAMKRGDKLAVACSKADYDSRVNLYGLAKGYDAKISSYGYHMIFNRRCLCLSDTTF